MTKASDALTPEHIALLQETLISTQKELAQANEKRDSFEADIERLGKALTHMELQRNNALNQLVELNSRIVVGD